MLLFFALLSPVADGPQTPARVAALLDRLEKAPSKEADELLQRLSQASPGAAKPHAERLAKAAAKALAGSDRQCGSAWELGKLLGKLGPECLPPLLAALEPPAVVPPTPPNRDGRTNVAAALGEASKLLSDERSAAAFPTAAALAERWFAYPAPHPARRALGEALAKFGPAAATTLVKGLAEDRHGSAWIRGLVKLGAPAAAPLADFLKGQRDDAKRLHAVLALRDLGPAAAPAVPALLALLDELKDVGPGKPVGQVAVSDRWLCRRETVVALGKIGPAAAAARQKLLALLDGPIPHLAGEAAIALGGIGLTAADVPEALRRVAGTTDAYYDPAFGLEKAFGAAGPGAVPALAEALGSGNAFVRHAAVRGLLALGHASKPAEAGLRKLLAEKPLRVEAALALQAAGLGAADAVPLLVADLAAARLDYSIKMGRWAVTAKELAPLAAEPAAAPALRELLQSGNPAHRAAALGLLALRPAERPALAAPARAALAGAKEPGVRAFAAAALGLADRNAYRGWAVDAKQGEPPALGFEHGQLSAHTAGIASAVPVHSPFLPLESP